MPVERHLRKYAEAEAEKLIAGQVKKGYVESNA
jgi:predicted DNA-binding WGR domain protein